MSGWANSPDAGHVLSHFGRVRALKLTELCVTLDLEEHLFSRRAHHLYKAFYSQIADFTPVKARSTGGDAP